MNHEPEPAGTLNRLAKPEPAGLDQVPLRDLAIALRARLPTLSLQASAGNPTDQLGLLSIELEVQTDVFANRFSRRRAMELFQMASRFVEAGQLQLEGATVVELGCGSVNPLAALLVHVLAGANAAHGFDLDPPQDEVAATRALARIATYMLAEPALLAPGLRRSREAVARSFTGFDLIKLWLGDPAGIDARRLQLHRAPAERTGLADASVDYCYSVSFLEHVADPAAAVAELARITRAGGCGAHSIDGKDHTIYARPELHALDFLREPSNAALVRGCNRLRPLQWVPLFERHGFEVMLFDVHERVEVPSALRAAFAASFRDLEDELLAVAGGVIFVRRRPTDRP